MIAEIIINNSGDKDIVFWGGWDNTELIREVEKVKKIKFVAVSPSTTKISRVCEHLASLSDKRDKYYVVIFHKETRDIRDMFTRFGYLADDVFYVNHVPVAVHNEGTDKYGNVVKGVEKYGRKVQLYFEGYGAKITLGEKISIGSALKINVGSEFKITIGDGSMIGAVSVVKRRCSNNCMIAGNPAKVLKKNIAWSRNPIPVDGAGMLNAERQYYNLTAEEGELYEC